MCIFVLCCSLYKSKCQLPTFQIGFLFKICSSCSLEYLGFFKKKLYHPFLDVVVSCLLVNSLDNHQQPKSFFPFAKEQNNYVYPFSKSKYFLGVTVWMRIFQCMFSNNFMIFFSGNNTEFSKKSICNQAMDAGPCDESLKRWFYSPERGTCMPFIYTGCAGNRSGIVYLNDIKLTWLNVRYQCTVFSSRSVPATSVNM